MATLGSTLAGAFDSVLPAAGTGPFSGAVGALGNLSGQLGNAPEDLLSGLDQPLQDLDGVVGRLPELFEPLGQVGKPGGAEGL